MPGGRGGRRIGTPGATYPNRTDLNATRTLPVQAPTGLPYGEHKALVDSQHAAPIVAPASAPPAPAPVGPPAVLPGSLPPLDRPSERPNEPVTHGAPLGAGAGPEVLGLADPTGDELRALYRRFPANEDLRALIETIDTGGF